MIDGVEIGMSRSDASSMHEGVLTAHVTHLSTKPALNKSSVDPSKKKAREEAGQCPSCGQQLYKLEPVEEVCCLARCFGKVVVNEDGGGGQQLMQKVPLTIPRLVERGQCLNCSGSGSGRRWNDAGSLSGQTMSTLDDAPDTMFPGMSSEAMNRGGEPGAVPNEISPLPKGMMQAPSLKPPPIANIAQAKRQAYDGFQPPASKAPPTNANIPEGAAVYTGGYNSYGEKHGEGEMVWSNGDTYKGNFVNDVREGHGTLTFAPPNPTQTDGGEYVGDWVNNQMHGSGTRRYPNGDVYMGGYKNGKRCGEGRFYYANGDMFWGEWVDNHMHGPGRYYYASGQRFEGTFLHSKRNGAGKLQRTDGTLEVYQYINDSRVGQGVRWSSDRTKAWRLWTPSTGRTGQSGCGSTPEKRSISIAEAVGMVSEIELASAAYQEDLAASRAMN